MVQTGTSGTESAGSASRYAAFVSYSHSDDEIADWLHRRLESYRIPKGISGQASGRIGKVFRDRAELASSHDLGGDIRRALDASDALILLCSPRAAKSPYVAEEIRRFKETGKGERIFAVIVDGEPHAAGKPGRSADEECFPQGLLYQVGPDGQFSSVPEPKEPIAADMRAGKDGRENGALKIIAGLLDVGLDDLVQREKHAERRRRLRANMIAGAMAVLALGAAVGGGFAWWLQGVAEARKGEAQQQTASALERLSNGIAREARAMFESESSDNTRSLLMALYADPAARSPAIPEGLAPKDGYALARARVIASHEGNRLDGFLTTGMGIATNYDSVISAVSYSPDQRLVVTATATGSVRVWDAASQKLLRTLPRRAKAIRSVSFSKDGSLLVVGAYDGVPQVWSTATWEQPLRLEGTEEGGETAISPDGALILGVVQIEGRYDFQIWDATSGKALRTIEGFELPVNDVVFSPDGSRFAGVSNGDVVRIWDVATGRPVWQADGGDQMNSVAFSPDGKKLAAGMLGGLVNIWELDGQGRKSTVRAHTNTVTSLEYSSDGTRLMTASLDGAIKIWNSDLDSWDADRGIAQQVFTESDQHTASAAFSPDGRHVVAGYYEGMVRLWDVASPTDVSTLAISLPKFERIEHAIFSPDGRSLAFVTTHTAGLWDIANGKMLFDLKANLGYRPSAAYSPDGKRLAIASFEEPTRIWDTTTGKILLELQAGTVREEVNKVVFSPDGELLATAAEGGDVRIWDARGGKLLQTLSLKVQSAFSAAFSKDSRTLAVGAFATDVSLWDVATGKQLRKLPGHEGTVLTASYSSDGRYLLTGSSDKTMRIWDAETGATVMRLLGHGDSVYDAQFSRDGRYVVSASADSTVKLWDATTGDNLATVRQDDQRLRSVSLSPDQTRVILSGAQDGLLIWTLPKFVTAAAQDQLKDGCTKLWRANAPLAFKVSDIATFGVLEGQALDPAHPDLLASPCRGVLPESAFDPATAKDGWVRVYPADVASAAPQP